jgi:hypothetical protein
MTADTTASPSGAEPRAFVLLKSRRRLDLLNPNPHAWTDDDLAAGLSRLTPSGLLSPALSGSPICVSLRWWATRPRGLAKTAPLRSIG